MGKYYAEISRRAAKNTWSLWTLGIVIFIYLVGSLAVAAIQNRAYLDALLEINSLSSVAIIFAGALLTFICHLVWEAHRVFPSIRVEGLDNVYDASLSIEIYNDDVKNIEGLSVELRDWRVVLNDGSSAKNVLPKNNVVFASPPRIGYGSHVNVAIARGVNGSLVFLLKEEYKNSLYQMVDEANTIAFDINLEIKGEVDGKTIYPSQFGRRVTFWSKPQQFKLDIGAGRQDVVESIAHIIRWEIIHEPKANFFRKNRRQ